MFSNALNKKEIAFYYLNVNREFDCFKKKNYNYGTVSYINGKFSNNKNKITSKFYGYFTV